MKDEEIYSGNGSNCSDNSAKKEEKTPPPIFSSQSKIGQEHLLDSVSIPHNQSKNTIAVIPISSQKLCSTKLTFS